MVDKIEEKGFLQRWSARKLEADRDAKMAVVPLEDAQPASVVADSEAPSDAEPSAPPPDLPDVENLDAESDYTGFLGDNVPEDLAKMALRKLWRSDPVLANIDGLNDYDADFSKVGMVSEVVKTVYQVGKGYLSADEAVEDSEESEDQTLTDQGSGDEAAAEPDAESGDVAVDGDPVATVNDAHTPMPKKAETAS
ncbi:DUF3306 domain-containing protein [Magnetovibrio sp.]|uniref:DUF3306 domain-containing protein n=1 Tax=Magnetovibrio sp. TaxID=2024836 RepID=UPI002F93179E